MLCFLIVSVLSSAVLRADVRDNLQDKYEFVPSTTHLVSIFRGRWLHVGTLDKNGDFTEVIKYDKDHTISMPYFGLVLIVKSGVKMYEYRSGYLIPGKIGEERNFIPGEGEKIMRFSDYEYSPTAVKIWNLPGYFKKQKTTAR